MGLQIDWTFAAIMLTAIASALALYQWTRGESELTWWQHLGVGVGALCGGMLGAKLPFLLSDWSGFLDGTAWLANGKTIVSGLLGGYLGAQVAEWAMHLEVGVCDGFAAPVALAVAIGRWGCFHAGCCYGLPTSMPWGVNFGDGLLRHPTQIYESMFHLTAVVVLLRLRFTNRLPGQHIRLYFLAYFIYRFATEFLRPEVRLWAGLTGYQFGTLFLALVLIAWGLPCCPSGWRRRRRRRKPRTVPITAEVELLKQVQTVCPRCLQTLSGQVVQQRGQVFLQRTCPEHGTAKALISGDRHFYYLRDEVPHPPLEEGGGCCGPAAHKSCIALFELTDDCNLQCPVCYASSPAGGHRPLADLLLDLDRFLEARGPLDVLQLSGGEPLLYPDLLPLIDQVRRRPVDHLMINTNGLELLRREELLEALRRRCPRLEISLQFDGLDAEPYRQLRGLDLAPRKREIVRKLDHAGIPTTLVATVVQNLNDDQLGRLIQFALEYPVIRGVTLQPATWSGRFDLPQKPMARLTLADTVRRIEQQTKGKIAAVDFEPLPCSDPNCCSFTFVPRRRPGRGIPLTRFVPVNQHLDQLADRINFKLDDADRCCGQSWRPEDLLRIVVKPFMDAHTYDQDRIDECCVHVIQPGGQAISFCQFNTLVRGRSSGGFVPVKALTAEGRS